MLSVKIQHVMLYRKYASFIQWSVEGILSSTGPLSFRVERSSNMFNDFVVLSEGVTDSYYIDSFESGAATVMSPTRNFVYRVIIEGQVVDVVSYPVNIYGLQLVTTGKVQAIGVVPVANQVDRRKQGYFFKHAKFSRRNILMWRAKARRAAVAQRLSGDPVAYLKKKHYGVRCQEPGCADDVHNISFLASACRECYGTSWEGGYHTPIHSYGIVEKRTTNVQDTEQGKLSMGSANIIAPAVPAMEVGDIIIETDRNVRWKVINVDDRFLFKKGVMQHLSCALIGRTDIEQLISLEDNRHILRFQ